MVTRATLPDLRLLAQDFFERDYAPGDCWRLVFDLLQAAGVVDVGAEVVDAVRQVQEIWFQDDPREPLSLVQPWDWLIIRERGPAAGHIGLVVDLMDLVHVHRHAGVRIEPMKRYRERIVQIARLRVLC